MLIGGFQKCSMIDYPDKLSAIVFSQGCNFRCPYCHNPELVLPAKFNVSLKDDEIIGFLKTRIGKLDGVVLTGGEVCLQKDLIQFAEKIKDLGFLIKLDTNGSKPDVVEKFLDKKLVDYFAMDIKTSPKKYKDFFASKISFSSILASIKLIMNSGVEYEFRTTVVKSLLTNEDFIQIGETINGAERYYLQKFVVTKLLDENYRTALSYSNTELEEIKSIMGNYVKLVTIR